ncbi:hypothetical protein B0H21DRAFT_821095 [Amylocystis lapponica]|nr:hypothetical protein B0H21DRAFT_821095 [Amylocystis lapponica]
MDFVTVFPAGITVAATWNRIMMRLYLINDTYACENDHMLNVLLKGELGFRGYVMSVWGTHMSTLSAVAGLNMLMLGDIAHGSSTNRTAFVLNDTIAEARLDDMAMRMLAGWYLLGQDQNYPNGAPVHSSSSELQNMFLPNLASENTHVDVQGDHYTLLREIGTATWSAVLLKNTPQAGMLLFSKPRNVVLVDASAKQASVHSVASKPDSETVFELLPDLQSHISALKLELRKLKHKRCKMQTNKARIAHIPGAIKQLCERIKGVGSAMPLARCSRCIEV